MTTTDDVLEHHLDTFVEQDLPGIMEDYADDAFVITNMGTFRGRDEIEGLFADLFEEFSQRGSTIEMDERIVEGDYAYIVWHAETPDNVYEFATDTFVIRDGEIVAQTFAGLVEPKG